MGTPNPSSSTPVFGDKGERLHVAGVDTLGAAILVRDYDDRFIHIDCTDAYAVKRTMPHVEISEHGVRLGCTFVTAEVIRRIARELESFTRSRTKVLQP